MLILLAAAACCRQGWYLVGAVLPAQDVVDVVCVAQRMDADGPASTTRTEPVSPLFPALVAAVHRLGSAVGLIDPRDWASPPQWIAAAALILAIFPLFLLTERMAGPNAAVTATLLFIALPAVSRLGGDGLGDAVHLCLVLSAAWLFVAERRVAAGLCVAAALLIRPEAAVLPLTVCLLAVPRSEFRVPQFFLAAAICLLPYFAVGVTSPTELLHRLRGGGAPTETVPLNASATNLIIGDGVAQPFGRRDPGRSARFHGLAATFDEYGTELLQASGFVLLPLVALGAWTVRRRGLRAGDRLLLVAAGLHLAILFVTAWRGGYLSTRHFALPVVLTLPYAAIGLAAACRRLAEARWNQFQNSKFRFQISDLRLQSIATAAFVVASHVVTVRPLHESRRPHRDAITWLESSERRSGAILDQQGFTALRSGRPTYRFEASAAALADPRLAYVVVERGDLEAETDRGLLLREALGRSDRATAAFPADRGPRARDVLVFSRPVPQVVSREVRDAR